MPSEPGMTSDTPARASTSSSSSATETTRTRSASRAKGRASLTARRDSRLSFQPTTTVFARRPILSSGTTSTGPPACITRSPGSSRTVGIGQNLGCSRADDCQVGSAAETGQVCDGWFKGTPPFDPVFPTSEALAELCLCSIQLFLGIGPVNLNNVNRVEALKRGWRLRIASCGADHQCVETVCEFASDDQPRIVSLLYSYVQKKSGTQPRKRDGRPAFAWCLRDCR